MNTFGDDQVGRSEDWLARHPGWMLFWPPFLAPLGTEYEWFRLVHVPTNAVYKSTVLGDLLDEMDGRCLAYGCGGTHAAPQDAAARR